MSLSTIINTSSPWSRIALYAAAGAGTFLAARAIYKEFTKYNLKDKVVLITGGSRGLGLVLARQLAAEGARIAICARSVDQLGQAHVELENLGAEVLSLAVDVTDPDQVESMIQDVIDHYGKLDVLINNAGIVQVAPHEALTIADYEIAMKTNFWASLYTMLSVIPHFKFQGEGRIVNITSIGGKIAVPHLLPYTASKHALVGLSEGMQAELKKDNIHVTTIVPNLMRTGSPRNVDVKGDHEAEYAWFKMAASSTMLSQDVEVSAKSIIKSIKYGDNESVLSFTGKAATIIAAVAPGWMGTVMRLANAFLPSNVSNGYTTKKGYESESELSLSWLGNNSDMAAERNNEY
jgi:NAD(P)-dependent dehydrogenase (short-subunit alcohol dehydrogenase family)